MCHWIGLMRLTRNKAFRLTDRCRDQDLPGHESTHRLKSLDVPRPTTPNCQRCLASKMRGKVS